MFYFCPAPRFLPCPWAPSSSSARCAMLLSYLSFLVIFVMQIYSPVNKRISILFVISKSPIFPLPPLRFFFSAVFGQIMTLVGSHHNTPSSIVLRWAPLCNRGGVPRWTTSGQLLQDSATMLFFFCENRQRQERNVSLPANHLGPYQAMCAVDGTRISKINCDKETKKEPWWRPYNAVPSTA